LEAAHQKQTDEIAAELAVHFEQGKDYGRAVRYLQQIGQNALRRAAYQDAVSSLTKGLELLQMLQDSPERIQQELGLQSTLGSALIVTKGYAVPEVERTYRQVFTLCQQVGETPLLFSALLGSHIFYLERAELQTARALAEQQWNLAERTQEPSLLLCAQWALGATLFYMGEVKSACDHLEQSVRLYDQHKHVFVDVMDATGAGCRCWLAVCLCYLGYLDQARQRAQEALALAREKRLPYSIVLALDAATVVSLNRGEFRTAHEGAEAIIALAHEQGFAYWLARGTMWKGLSLVAQGQEDEGFAQVRQGYMALLAVGSDIHKTFQSVPMAHAYGAAGQPEEGLKLLTEALAFVEKTGARCSEAEIYRGKGELTLQRGTRDWGLGAGSSPPQAPSLKPQVPSEVEREAEECFLKAIETARQQGAKALELQAALSLGRLWQHEGKRDQARQMLAEIYSWFTEGFDTADLREARALLKELA
jgi:predicted ATPase